MKTLTATILLTACFATLASTKNAKAEYEAEVIKFCGVAAESAILTASYAKRGKSWADAESFALGKDKPFTSDPMTKSLRNITSAINQEAFYSWGGLPETIIRQFAFNECKTKMRNFL